MNMKRCFIAGLALLMLALLYVGCAPKTPATPVATPTPAVELVDEGLPLAPKVIAQRPVYGEESPLDTAFEIIFDQAMDTSKTSTLWQVIDPDGIPLAGHTSWPDERTLLFQPDLLLQPDSSYQVILGTSVTSAEGVPLAAERTFVFNTVERLQVVQVFPDDGTFEVETDALITAMFNRPVVPLTTAEEQVGFPQPLRISPPVDGQGEWLSTSVYVFRPEAPLTGGTTYTATIQAGLTDVTGSEATRLMEDVSWQFSTVAPTISSLKIPDVVSSPPDGYSDMPLNATFAVGFRQPMDQASVEAAFSLTSFENQFVPGIFEWDDDGLEMTFIPNRLLDLGMGYTLNLSRSARALDGGNLSDGLFWRFHTVFPPAIMHVTPANGTVQTYFTNEFVINFTSPMDQETLENRVVVTPRPEGGIRWNYYSRKMVVYGLEPSTAYKVRILPGMADPYGNRILEGMTVNFVTAELQPSAFLQTPGSYTLLRAQGKQEVYLQYVNVETIDFSLYRMSPEQFVTYRSKRIAAEEHQPWQGDLVHAWTETTTGPRDQDNLKSIELTTSEGDPLPPGIYFLGMKSSRISSTYNWLSARVLIVATANMTLKSTLSEALLWLTDLETGEPVSDVPIFGYDRATDSLGRGTSDASGLLRLDLVVPEGRYEERYYFAQDDQNFAFASSHMGSDVYPYDFGIRTNYYLDPNQVSVYLYTDRPLYRPGHTVYFKGIVRLNDDLEYTLPTEEEVEVTVSSYGETVFEQTLPLSTFGTFDGDFKLDEQAALGDYSIRVRFPEEETSIGWRSFNVAEYRKPEFQVDIQASASDVLDGDTVELAVSADFFSGGAVADAEVSWVLRTQDYMYRASGEFSRFQFLDFEYDAHYWYQEPFSYSDLIAEGEGRTNEHGEFLLSLPVDLSELGSSQRLTFEATVTDLANNEVSSRVQIVAHLSEFYIGVRPQNYVGRAGSEETFEFVVLDWDGEPVASQSLEVAIVERRWHSVQEVDENGRTVWVSSVEEIPVASFSDVIVGEDGRASVSFTPPVGGVYSAKATSRDKRGTQVRSSAYMWVSGANYVSWRRSNDHSIQLITDREDYQPGDTAEIMIASPFQGEIYALVTVERGHIRYAEVIKLRGNSAIYRLPITAEMAPNVYVSVILIKGVDDTSPLPDYRMGLTEIAVDTREQTLNIELSPDQTHIGPGDQVTFDVRATDHQGQPVHAEFSLALVDLALLTLTDPNSPPLIDHFYDARALSVFTAMPLTLSIEAYNVEIREHAKGGGGGGGDMGIIEVREEFPDTAFWQAYLVTDEQGEARVTVSLPDSLTTWRMDARAVTLNTHVGQNTTDIVTSKPLLVRPQTPRFFVADDELWLGTAVHNNTEDSLTASVTLSAEGLTIAAQAQQEVDIPAGAQAFVRWPVRVEEDAERADLVFKAVGGGYSDASRPTLGSLEGQGIPVYQYVVPETVATAGELTAGGSRTESVSLPIFPDFELQEGQLTLSLAPSLVAGFTDGLTYLEHFPYECTEQTVSRFLPNLITMRALKSAGISDPDLEANLDHQVNIALQRLYNQQHADGGWGWWPTRDSHPLSTAYVVHGLVEAETNGYSINETVLEDAIDFLYQNLVPVEYFEATHLLNRQAYILYVLARAGQPAVSETINLYDSRQSLSLFARGFLAQTIFRIDEHDPRLDTLISDFVNHAALSATGTHWNETYHDFWNWNTDTRTTAIVLDTLILIDPENSLNVEAIRWLMANRKEGRWRGTQETAWALMALTRWAVYSDELEPQYLYEAALNGERLGGGAANTTTLRITKDFHVEVADLFLDQINRLTIARNDGPGNLYYTTYLTVSMPVEQIQALDRGITLARSYFHPDDRETSISEITQGETFLGRLTIIVPNDLHYVFIEDPLPAGVEAVDQSLKTSRQASAPSRYDWDDLFLHGWGWWYFDHVELRDEKVVLSASYLPAGVYEYTYLLRATTPGTFRVIPPTAYEFYFPEVYGRGAGTLFEVTQ
ncbi:MAG: hypothetical protein GTO14_16665 [Anaerolineales bacterium]|nr:hypothetical protein [Anaerolineales bacterium]